jgi:hypothetical protein
MATQAEKTLIMQHSYADDHSRALATAGALLFVASLVNGFVIHIMPLRRLALSAHLVGLIASTFLVGLSGLWPRLQLPQLVSGVGTICAVYGFWAGWIVYFSAALLGAGGMFPILSGDTSGTPFLESALKIAMATVAVTLFALSGIVLRGLSKPK